MIFLISLAVLLMHSSTVQGLSESSCAGKCVSIYSCPSLLSLIRKNNTPQEVETIRKAHCGFEGQNPKVCCEERLGTVTPTAVPIDHVSESCKCVKLSQCAGLLALTLRQNRTTEETQSLRKSTCGFEGDHPMVCCDSEVCKPTIALANRKSGCCGHYSPKADRLVFFGAKAVSVDQYPWLVYIDYLVLSGKDQGKVKFMCGGVLLSGNFVLTAARCVAGKILERGTPVDVRLGEYHTNLDGRDCTLRNGGGEDCGDGLVIIPIEKTIAHPAFEMDILRRNDIGLIKMKHLAPYNDIIRPICLPREDITRNTQTPTSDYIFKVAAWGKIDEKIYGSKIKVHEDMPYRALNECQTFYNKPRRTIELWEGQICAGDPNKDPCNSDPGGPLMYENDKVFEVLGVNSFGAPCGFRPIIPDVYTKVFSYLPWIRSVIQKQN